MNADEKNTFAELTPRPPSRELSQRVKRLEFLRTDACAHRDRVRVSLIDQQIKSAILQWCDSYVMDIEVSDRSGLKGCQSPISTVN
jgi:hypothetical protein